MDSSTWLQGVVYGRIDSLRFNKRVSRRFSKEFAKENRKEIMYIAYLEAMEMQSRYLYK